VFTATSPLAFSASIGPFPGVTFSNCCVINGVPNQPCEWTQVTEFQYDNSCTNGVEGYRRSLSVRFVVAEGQQVSVVTSSAGLMAPKSTAIAPPLSVSTDADSRILDAPVFRVQNVQPSQRVAPRASLNRTLTTNDSRLAMPVPIEGLDGNQNQNDAMFSIRNRIQCATAELPNPRECTFTATSTGYY
jgi:hypothetical protein